MTLQYCSDLHLELPRNERFLELFPLQPQGEVLLLAGDIIPFDLHKWYGGFIDFIADNFEMVYWVPGNHEYYGYDLKSVANPLLEKLRSNVWLVNNEVVSYRNVEFICCTLWSKILIENKWEIKRNIPDFTAIRYQDGKLSTEQYNQLHDQSVIFLKE